MTGVQTCALPISGWKGASNTTTTSNISSGHNRRKSAGRCPSVTPKSPCWGRASSSKEWKSCSPRFRTVNTTWPAELARLMDVSVKVERLARGESTDIHEAVGPGGGPVRLEQQITIRNIEEKARQAIKESLGLDDRGPTERTETDTEPNGVKPSRIDLSRSSSPA